MLCTQYFLEFFNHLQFLDKYYSNNRVEQYSKIYISLVENQLNAYVSLKIHSFENEVAKMVL